MSSRIHRFGIILLLLSILLGASVLTCQQKAVVDDSFKQDVIDRIGTLLVERYVFPDVGQQCADHLKTRLKEGAFADISDEQELAQALTRELYSISKDKHMRVRVRPQRSEEGSPEDPLLRNARQSRFMAEGNYGLAKVEVMEGNIGYLDIRWFPPIEAARPTASAAMAFLANVDALIIDLRRNSGGNPGTIQYICSYFFAERTHLNSLYWREGDRLQEFWTLDDVEGKKIPDVPIFVLTSNRTFSGGEEFAYNLKTRKRGTLIGEVTGGGANPGGTFPLPGDFMIFVPTGRAINPVTNTNWEGTGVEPDVKMDADDAFDRAVELAKDAVEKRRGDRNEKDLAAVTELRTSLDAGERMFTEGKADLAQSEIDRGLDQGIEKGLLEEAAINAMGYRYLGEEKYDVSIAIFRYNVNRYPESWNVYDSLGEALMNAGKKEEAIRNYKKSLELNPDNEGA